ncbi:hypothetical protein D3C85_1037210 [compost metagenome]
MGGEEGQDDIGGELADPLAHHADKVVVALDRAGADAEGRARAEEGQGEEGDQRTIQRIEALRGLGVGVDEGRAGQEGDQGPDRDHGQDGQAREQQAAFLGARQRRLFLGCGGRGGGGNPRPEARLDHPVGQEPDDGGEDEDDADNEEPVAGDADGVGRIDQVGGRLGDAEDQGVAGAGEEVARVSARDGGESGGQTGQRVAARGGEDDGGQRNDHHIGGVRGVVRHHARHHDDRGQDESRRVQQGAANGGREHACALCD